MIAQIMTGFILGAGAGAFLATVTIGNRESAESDRAYRAGYRKARRLCMRAMQKANAEHYEELNEKDAVIGYFRDRAYRDKVQRELMRR